VSADPQFDLWRAERENLTPEERRLDRPTDPKLMGGYWRVVRAKTRHDTPIMIWTRDGTNVTLFQRFATRMNTVDDTEQWQNFIDKDWLKCVPVTKEEWASAIETGFWTDGKPSRQMSQDEKLGIDTSVGDNDAPPEEMIGDQIAALAEKAAAAKVTDQASADEATGILDRLRVLLGKAEDTRKVEKEPHWLAGKAVDEKWKGVMTPGTTASETLEARRKAWLKAEQKRLDAEAAAERKRLADEAEARRIQAEKDAKAKGEPAPVIEPEPEPVVETKRATAGTAYGRQSGLKKTKVATITDLPMLVNSLVFAGEGPDADCLAYFQSRADKAMRASITLPGVTITEEMK